MGFIYEVGDIVTLKKGHPCGSKEWEILRVGADFRLKCMGCGKGRYYEYHISERRKGRTDF